MLDKKFKNSMYFKGANMTVKQFLDYVINHPGDWYIKSKPISSDELFSIPKYTYYLSCYDNGRTRGQYKLDNEDMAYLAEHNNYFKSKLVMN